SMRPGISTGACNAERSLPLVRRRDRNDQIRTRVRSFPEHLKTHCVITSLWDSVYLALALEHNSLPDCGPQIFQVRKPARILRLGCFHRSALQAPTHASRFWSEGVLK